MRFINVMDARKFTKALDNVCFGYYRVGGKGGDQDGFGGKYPIFML